MENIKKNFLRNEINDLIIFNVHLTWVSSNNLQKYNNNLKQFNDFIDKINTDFNPTKDNIILLSDFNRTDLSLYSSNNFKNIKNKYQRFDYFLLIQLIILELMLIIYLYQKDFYQTIN